MKKLSAEITNGQFHNIYLLAGPEGYLRRQYSDRLKDAIVGGDTMNYTAFKGQGQSVESIIDICDTVPFFADKRLVFIEGSDLFTLKKGEDKSKSGDKQGPEDSSAADDKPGSGAKAASSKGRKAGASRQKAPVDALIELMENLPVSTVIVFSEEAVDKRSRLYKAVQKHGSVTEFPIQKKDILAKWIIRLSQKENRAISLKDAAHLVDTVGTDMTNLSLEWEKLCCYAAGEGAITGTHIDAICVRTPEDKVFEMIDCMSAGDSKRAFFLYDDLLSLGTNPHRVLSLIVRHFRILNGILMYSGTGLSRKELASKVGVMDFFIDKYNSQIRSYGAKGVRAALEACAKTETDIKTGRVNDNIGVELLIVSCIPGGD